jgi:CoA:oxalate CoA-transferase
VNDVMADEHFRMRGSFSEVRDRAGSFRVLNPPFKMSAADCTTGDHVSELGADNRDVLSRLAGLDESQIAALTPAQARH